MKTYNKAMQRGLNLFTIVVLGSVVLILGIGLMSEELHYTDLPEKLYNFVLIPLVVVGIFNGLIYAIDYVETH